MNTWKQFQQFFAGLGYVAPPDPGNTANAPAAPPVQTGPYEFLQPFTYQRDNRLSDIPTIPPGYQNWDQFPLNLFGLSGLEGGGITGNVPDQYNQQGASLYYDSSNGLYINLGNGEVSPVLDTSTSTGQAY